jgi:hypothetical protein
MFKKYIFIAFCVISLLSIVFIIFKVSSSKKTEVLVSPTPYATIKPVDLSSIIPGTTTKEDVLTVLGKPLKSSVDGTTETLNYSSTNKNLDSQIITDSGVVVFIKEFVSVNNKTKVSEITNNYGLSNYSFFGPDYAGGNKLYVYPSKGIAYIGDPKFDYIEQLWRFIPTTIEDFRGKWAANYTEKKVLNLY